MSNLETRFRKAQNGSPKLDEVEPYFGQEYSREMRSYRRYVCIALCILLLLTGLVIATQGG
jgi:hypothetical protein